MLALSEIVECRFGNEDGGTEVMGFIFAWFLRVCCTSSAIESRDERDGTSPSVLGEGVSTGSS